MRKINIKESPAATKLIVFAGKKISKMTVGKLARLLCIKADKEIRNNNFVDLAIDIARNVFVGNQPFVEGTPEGDTLLRLFRRISKFKKTIKDSQGNELDLYETLKHTVGNYGIDDYNATLKLN